MHGMNSVNPLEERCYSIHCSNIIMWKVKWKMSSQKHKTNYGGNYKTKITVHIRDQLLLKEKRKPIHEWTYQRKQKTTIS